MGGTFRAGGYTITNCKSYVQIQNDLQAYVSEQPQSDPTLIPVPSQSQDNIIYNSKFTGNDKEDVNVEVYGASENNIFA